VAIKCGYTLEGILRSYAVIEKHEPLLGQRFDYAVHSRLRTDA
jgi:hypothetical protein